jgi:hypothetical protein
MRLSSKQPSMCQCIPKRIKKFLDEEYPFKLNKAEELKNEEMLKKANNDKKAIEDKLKSKESVEIVIHAVVKTLVAFANSNGGE